MSTAPRTSKNTPRKIDYPTGDGKPMAETEVHRELLGNLVDTLKGWCAADPMAYASGNMLMFYEEGNRRKHVSPDVFFVRGIPNHIRENYLIWEEGRGPDVVIELTSKTTKNEDQRTKMALYRDVLHVAEYFLFDPYRDYLRPDMQGYRLVDGRYVLIEPVAGRLPSAVLGLHLERDGMTLRLRDPATGQRLPTLAEQVAAGVARADMAEMRADMAEMRADMTEARAIAEQARAIAEQARAAAEQARAEAAEDTVRRLLRELEELRRPTGGP